MSAPHPSTITLAEALHIIDSGRPFDIEVVQCDVKRGTGGALRGYAHCVKHMQQKVAGQAAAAGDGLVKGAPRNPNHYLNSTRNIFLTDVREMKKVHIRLITRLNGRILI